MAQKSRADIRRGVHSRIRKKVQRNGGTSASGNFSQPESYLRAGH